MGTDSQLTRFIQRRGNFNWAFDLTIEALSIVAPPLIRGFAIVKAFELTFESSWKVLRERLEYEGVLITTPREALKHAFKFSLVKDGQGWIDLLDLRNRLIHVYDETQAQSAVNEISTKAIPLFKDLHAALNTLEVD